MTGLEIVRDPLTGPEIAALLQEHLDHMHATSPRESVHALDLEALRAPDIAFWTAWSGGRLAGCGALRQLSPDHGEVKSMRTHRDFLKQGVAAAILAQIVAVARARNYLRVSLETGTQDAFVPARALYTGFGFEPCPAFGEYRPDPNSAYFTLAL